MLRPLNSNKKLQAYIIGVALGDGNLSNPNGRATRLCITCDRKYPRLIRKMRNAIKLLLPKNKVSLQRRHRTFLDISCYSNYWPKLLGWNAKKGSKFSQKVSIPCWIKRNKQYIVECLRGLFETDGSIYLDRGYKMVMFTSIIPNLANDVYNLITSLGFKPHIYKLKQNNKSNLYHIRVSKNISEFLNLIKLKKR